MSRWEPIYIGWDACGEGALDLRFLQDAPAGRHGFVQARDGRLMAEDGTRVRFFGVNLVFGAAFPAPEQAPVVAERLARAGVNLVRVHHADSPFGPAYLDYSGGSSRKLSAEHMDRFDRLFAELKQRGIYLHLDLYTLRRWQRGDGLSHPDDIGAATKWITYFDERIIALQEEMAGLLLTHRNPYTGLRYVDDPAVAVVQIVNENSAFWWDRVPPAPYLADVQAAWNGWLLDQYGGRAGLGCAWTGGDGACALGPNEDPAAGSVAIGPVGVWNEWVSPPDQPPPDLPAYPVRIADWRRFLDGVQRRLYRRRAAHLRGLGLRCCINATNLPNGVSGLPSMAELDVCEHNCYWDHPLDGFEPPVRFHLAPAVRSEPSGWDAPFTRSLVAHLSQGRVAGRPFIVTEYYQSMPNPWRAECVPFLAAYAAFQDWDGLCLFSFSHGDWDTHRDQRHLSGMFNGWNDPSVWGTLPLAALLFRRGDVAPARRRVAVAYGPLDTLLPYPDWRRPYDFLPFLSRVETAFAAPEPAAAVGDGALPPAAADGDGAPPPAPGRYRGNHDAVVAAGFAPDLDLSSAAHALVYARRPCADAAGRVPDPAGPVRLHRPDLADRLDPGGRRLRAADLPPGTVPLALSGPASAAAAGPGGTAAAVIDGRCCLVTDPAALAAGAPDWLRQAYAAAMRAWDMADGARIEPGRHVSDTGQLDWDWHAGILRLDTPRTQGCIGFAGGRRVELGRVAIELETAFAVVAAAGLDGEPLAACRRLLVTAVARSENTGMRWNPEHPHQLLDQGGPPVRFEPVTGWLDLPPGRRTARAWALDPSGRRLAPAELAAGEGRARLRLGSGGPALYYEVELA